ncbi:PucR family transcriptional regulator [Amycolatopsis marina]|uniref:PucR family transcriptional regulator n=1 Tax=Amycolatopsis marina TaxID=490629 RepID=UPI0015A58233|nr:helix-turn-helix domain-containing protein [Amycolatopsis marina]
METRYPMAAGQELRINGALVHRRLLSRLPELTSSVLDSSLRDVPFYRELPDEEVAGDIARVVEDNLRLVATLVRDRRVPDEAELAVFAESAARRAEEGVPLEMVLHAYHVGAHEAWRVITQDAPPADVADMRATTDLVLSYLRAAVAAVSGAYTAELRAMYSQQQSVRHTLLSALLAGERADEAAERAGVRLPASYLVLVLRFGKHKDEQEDGVGATIAARRKLRRAQVELDRFTDDSVLSLLDPESGTVLLPGTRGLDAAWDDLDLLVERMTEAAAVEVTAAAAHAAPDDVAAAVIQGREILDIVRHSRRPAGLYQLADVLLEYQLSRPTPARHALGALLEPLACNDDLLTTLRVHLTNELNRRRTARMLHIHPNTVDYRLRRIATLTGLDPALPSHLPVLVAALAARRSAESPA